MRLLKKKIALCRRKAEGVSSSNESEEDDRFEEKIIIIPKEKLITSYILNKGNQPKRNKKTTEVRRRKLALKNILKNYGRAIGNFAASELSLPYINRLLKDLNLDKKAFMKYAIGRRDIIQNIENFRDSILPIEHDSQETIACKKVFQLASEVFMKYFSVNWIFTGKMIYKLEYLKFRAGLLRRIKYPDSFINLNSQAFQIIIKYIIQSNDFNTSQLSQL